jgi:hypothetical protein
MKLTLLLTLALLGCPPFSTAQTTPAKPATEVIAPPGVDAKQTSADPEYGYSKEKPVKVGAKDEFGGPAAERAYLQTLRDEAGKSVKFERLGSVGVGPDGNVLDLYEVTTSTGKTLKIHIDMYHPKNDPKKQPAPAGLFKAR